MALLRILALLSIAASTLRGATVTIVPRCVNTGDCTVSGVFTIEGPHTPRRDIPIESGVARASVDPNDVDLELHSPAYWMPRQRLGTAETQQVSVWRTTVFRGRIVVQKPEELPKNLTAEIQSPPGASGPSIAAGTALTCPVAQDGSWQCRLPATPLDLTLRAKSFVPVYLWAVNLKPNSATDAGTIALKQGASFVAWLESKTARSLKKPATARLMRMTMANSPTLGPRMNAPVAEGTFNQRGMLQLAPIAAGTYMLEVTAPGFAPTQFDKVPIYESRETKFRLPITLDAPLTIRLSIQPAHDPDGKPWHVAVGRAEPMRFRGTAVAEAFPADGTIEIADQPPGRYNVRVMDGNGNWYVDREFDIQNAADAQRTIDITLLHLSGKIVAGDKPIAARLFFGGRSGSQRVSTTSGEDGKFTVELPRPGTWTIEVDTTAEDIAAVIKKTIAPDQKNLDITLPNTDVAGWVAGPDGRRVAGATVTCSTIDGVTSRETNPEGSFRFRGVSAGPAHLIAHDTRTGEYSRAVDLTIAAGAHHERVELQIDHLRTMKGRVLAQGEPVAGARVSAYALDGGWTKIERAVTNLDGSFALRVGPSVTRFSLVIAAAGRPLQGYSATASNDLPALNLAQVGGGLHLRWKNAGRPTIDYNGTLIPLLELLEWARAHGSTPSGDGLDVSNVAPGVYALCVVKDGANSCKDGRLAPGSELTLTAP